MAELEPLTRSVVLGMPPACKHDIVNILIDGTGSADEAEHLLAANRVTDLEIWDLLAASYSEVGRLDDARQINDRAIEMGDRSSDEDRCHRLVRRIELMPAPSRPWLVDDLTALVAKRAAADPTCQRLLDKARCAVAPSTACREYFQAQHIDLGYVQLFSAYYAWPKYSALPPTWEAMASAAASAMPLPGAEELVAVALDAAVRGGHCGVASLTWTLQLARRLAPERAATVRAAMQAQCPNVWPHLAQH